MVMVAILRTRIDASLDLHKPRDEYIAISGRIMCLICLGLGTKRKVLIYGSRDRKGFALQCSARRRESESEVRRLLAEVASGGHHRQMWQHWNSQQSRALMFRIRVCMN